MSDEDWAKRFQEWNYVNRLQLKTQETVLKKVLVEVVNDVFKAMNKKGGKNNG